MSVRKRCIKKCKSKRRSTRRRKSAAQMRHQKRAAKAMDIWQSGRARSLKAAWKRV